MNLQDQLAAAKDLASKSQIIETLDLFCLVGINEVDYGKGEHVCVDVAHPRRGGGRQRALASFVFARGEPVDEKLFTSKLLYAIRVLLEFYRENGAPPAESLVFDKLTERCP